VFVVPRRVEGSGDHGHNERPHTRQPRPVLPTVGAPVPEERACHKNEKREHRGQAENAFLDEFVQKQVMRVREPVSGQVERLVEVQFTQLNPGKIARPHAEQQSVALRELRDRDAPECGRALT